MKLSISTKNIKYDKKGSNIYILMTISVLVTIFCLVSTKALLDQASYQRRVINARNATVKQLKNNLRDASALAESYAVFNSGTTNVIGGKNITDLNAKPPDGDNGRIVLNALPSNYDFPALISSMAKILADNGIGSPSIGGNDQSAEIGINPQAPNTPIATPLSLGGKANYAAVQQLIKDLERSTRPFDIKSLQLSGANSDMTISMELNTYFQPAKQVSLTDKEVK